MTVKKAQAKVVKSTKNKSWVSRKPFPLATFNPRLTKLFFVTRLTKGGGLLQAPP